MRSNSEVRQKYQGFGGFSAENKAVLACSGIEGDVEEKDDDGVLMEAAELWAIWWVDRQKRGKRTREIKWKERKEKQRSDCVIRCPSVSFPKSWRQRRGQTKQVTGRRCRDTAELLIPTICWVQRP